jgi:3-hydroxybutyryl-CoA dehydrogenase
MAEAGIIIEAATEREEIKQTIFAAGGEVLGGRRDPREQHQLDLDHPDGRGTVDPARFIGLHFFNPVP